MDKYQINIKDIPCEEASMFSSERYIPCGQVATHLVYHKRDKRIYAMCMACADHNVRNREGKYVLGQEVS